MARLRQALLPAGEQQHTTTHAARTTSAARSPSAFPPRRRPALAAGAFRSCWAGVLGFGTRKKGGISRRTPAKKEREERRRRRKKARQKTHNVILTSSRNGYIDRKNQPATDQATRRVLALLHSPSPHAALLSCCQRALSRQPQREAGPYLAGGTFHI